MIRTGRLKLWGEMEGAERELGGERAQRTVGEVLKSDSESQTVFLDGGNQTAIPDGCGCARNGVNGEH